MSEKVQTGNAANRLKYFLVKYKRVTIMKTVTLSLLWTSCLLCSSNLAIKVVTLWFHILHFVDSSVVIV